MNVGNVADFAFDESGSYLAYTIDARDDIGNGVQLRNLRTDVVRALDADQAMYRRMTWAGFRKAVYATLEVSCMTLLLVAASNYFGAVFSRLGSANLIAESLLTLSFSPTIMLLLILAIIFVLGWPLEWVPIVLIVVPILLPLVSKLGIDLVWFCTLVAVCLQTAWLSPPVALSAYFLKGVVPDWSLSDIYAGMMQFLVLQVLGLLLVLFFPQLALWLPALMRD